MPEEPAEGAPDACVLAVHSLTTLHHATILTVHAAKRHPLIAGLLCFLAAAALDRKCVCIKQRKLWLPCSRGSPLYVIDGDTV